jgi:hypothetical protein
MLFISRLIYRLFEAYLHMHNGLPLDPDFLGNPISSWLFGLLGGFYGVYAGCWCNGGAAKTGAAPG